MAGAVCGPAAGVCGAAFAVSANAGWDGIDSAIAGETRGFIRQVKAYSIIIHVHVCTGRSKVQSVDAGAILKP